MVIRSNEAPALRGVIKLGSKGASRFWGLFISLLIACVSRGESQACLLRIIHTNDLHSHLERSHNPDLGGYAAVKALIDSLREESRRLNIPTLVLDAGDFSEGSEFYFADRGLRVWEIMNSMGYDAVTIGNHDWLMGLDRLDEIVGETQPRFAFLGANFIFTSRQANLRRWMKPHARFVRGPARIAVLGLTTDENYYSWRVENGFIADPINEAIEDVPDLKRDNHFVIVLSHLGIRKDIQLIRNTEGIDLVIGGHSHTFLDSTYSARDRSGRIVKIAQAGYSGQAVGDLWVDACPGFPLEVLRYRLLPVHASGPKDSRTEEMIRKTRADLEAQFGTNWWHEILGFSEVPLKSPEQETTEWGNLVAESFRRAGRAVIGIDLSVFNGRDQEAGPIDRGKIVSYYPHSFEVHHRHGYTVWTAAMDGWALRWCIDQLYSLKIGYSIAGAHVETQRRSDGQLEVREIYVNGVPVSNTSNYRVALPEAIIRGAIAVSGALRIIFQSAEDTGIPVWTAIERQVRETGVLRPRNHDYQSIQMNYPNLHGFRE